MEFLLIRLLKLYRNLINATISGFIFTIGWWFAVDAAFRYPDNRDLLKVSHISGAIGTLGFLMLNSIDFQNESNCLGKFAKPWLFATFLLSFSAIISAFWIFFDYYIYRDKYYLPGLQILVQNICIIISSFLFKFGRTQDIF